MRESTQEEIAAYDRFVQSRREYTVYTNLSRLFNERPSAFTTVAKSSDDFGKRGLAWVVALARLELLAMTSVYGNGQDMANLRAPTKFEKFAFNDLLTDAMRSHVWGLANDKRFERVKEQPVGPETFAYARRLTLALRFLKSYAMLYGSKLKGNQVAQLKSWKSDMRAQAELMQGRLERFISQVDVSSDTTKSTQRKTIEAYTGACDRRQCIGRLAKALEWIGE